MGVVGLFAYLLRSYRESIQKITRQGNYPDLYAVYLDGNALLYPIAEDTKIPEEIASILLSVAREYAKKFNCKCYLYIDGAAHMAKIRQQRMRRFLTGELQMVTSFTTDVGSRTGDIPVPTMRHSSILGYDVPTRVEWSTAMFSPGTEMMKRIHQFLEKNKGDIEYSSYLEPGEGEHKILQHIKDTMREYSGTKKVGIVGKDADLVLLAMGLNENIPGIEPYILRHNDRIDDGGNPSGFKVDDPLYIINCSSLRNEILLKMVQGRSIWDFIIATFLLGNDFFPAIPELGSIRDCLPILLPLIPKLVQNERINENALLSLLSSVTREIERNKDVRKIVYSRWLPSSYEKDPSPDISIEAFDVSYRFLVSPFPVNVPACISSWLITMQWVFAYYYHGYQSASVSWQYPFSFSPSLFMLKSLKNIKVNTMAFVLEKKPPLQAVQALAAILPPWLHSLLPPPVQDKMDNIQQYYPYGYTILTPLKEPMIPFIPYDAVSTL